jgi:hypothetical protein
MSKYSPLVGLPLVLAIATCTCEKAPAPGKEQTVRNREDGVLAIGSWSDSVKGLRGRLVIARGRILGDCKTRETMIYLDLKYAPEAVGKPLDVQFNPNLHCEVGDGAPKAVPRAPMAASGATPAACWVTLPHDSTMRLRLSPYGIGRPGGLLIHLNGATWFVAGSTTDEHFLSGTFKSEPPKGHGRANAWQGTLTLAGVKIPSMSSGR